MKKRWLRWLVCIVMLLPLTTATVRADCAPKPSVNVDVICGRNVIVTLLADREGYGPNYTIAPVEEPGQWLDYNSEPERRAWERFRDYQDPDGFRFWGWMEWHGIDWGYYCRRLRTENRGAGWAALYTIAANLASVYIGWHLID